MISPGIEKLAELGAIEKPSFTWWDLDYKKDPRVFYKFDEFQKRLEFVGECSSHNYPKKIFIYTGQNVPVSTLDIKVEKEDVRLFITVRPYTPKELSSLNKQSEINSVLRKKVKNNNPDIRLHFLPHIRGYVKEKVNKRILYYPVKDDKQIEEAVNSELKRLDKDFLVINEWYGYTSYNYFISDKVKNAKGELDSKKYILTQRNNNSMPLKSVDIKWPGLEFVVYDEFTDEDKELICYYPFRAEDMSETIPIAISTRTRPNGNSGFFVLGVFNKYEDSYIEFRKSVHLPELSFFPFTDEKFARSVAKQLSKELKLDLQSVLFCRKKGKCDYVLLD